MTPLISVVIPTFNRPAELRVCLNGFACQTIAAEQFEVVIVDDGSAEDIGEIAASFRDRFPLHVERCDHAGTSVARNLAIARSRAPLLLLYDDDLCPLPGLIETCLRFHARHPAVHEAQLLRFAPDPAIGDMAVVRWAFDRLYPFPSSEGVYAWEHFWGGAVTCKRALFAEDVFDPEFLAVEDAEFARRASIRHPIAIHYTAAVGGHFHRRLGVLPICRRQYRMAYFRHLLAVRHGVHFGHAVYERPGDFLIADWPAYRALLSALRQQETAIMPPSSARFQMLGSVWQKASLHATASGWLAAQSDGGLETSLFE
jgi:glycosyltransferase involved in cell wall biosynthesis